MRNCTHTMVAVPEPWPGRGYATTDSVAIKLASMVGCWKIPKARVRRIGYRIVQLLDRTAATARLIPEPQPPINQIQHRMALGAGIRTCSEMERRSGKEDGQSPSAGALPFWLAKYDRQRQQQAGAGYLGLRGTHALAF